jgi:folylpolyglutamate synthase
VGIGGEYDCTNVVRNSTTVGITSLGLEHTRLLGNTIQEISWQKAGIIKKGSNVFTVQQQDESIKVIRDRCLEKEVVFRFSMKFRHPQNLFLFDLRLRNSP